MDRPQMQLREKHILTTSTCACVPVIAPVGDMGPGHSESVRINKCLPSLSCRAQRVRDGSRGSDGQEAPGVIIMMSISC